MAEKAILFDTARCSACRGCQVACKCWNNLPSPIEPNCQQLSGSYQHPLDLNGDTRLIITFDEREAETQKGIEWAFGRRACQHCTDAACVSVCPAGALTKDEESGMVTVDDTKCVGCQYCSTVCPYGVPHYYGAESKINKCTGCVDRIEHGMEPACVSTCQPNALEFGDRDEMIKKAYASVARLKKRGYDRAMVYGETEMGGLHVIQVLKYGIEQHGQVENPKPPATAAINSVLKPVTGVVTPLVVVGLGAMAVLASGYKRDKLIYNEATGDTMNAETGAVVKSGDGQDERTIGEAITENLPFGKSPKVRHQNAGTIIRPDDSEKKEGE